MNQRDKGNQKRPVCPDCGEKMVKAQVEWEDGSWSVVWLCGCFYVLTALAFKKV